jgi:hypothetical protein
MEPGDALFFDAAARHGPEELIEKPMQYLSIIIRGETSLPRRPTIKRMSAGSDRRA